MLLDITIDNWHPCTERQAIYNIHSIDSSNEIIHLLEYLRLSLGLTAKTIDIDSQNLRIVFCRLGSP